MQRYVLFAFKKVLLSSPSLLNIFRAEGVWDFIFSENFFYFSPAPAEFFRDYGIGNVFSLTNEYSGSSLVEYQADLSEIGILQLEAISFMEFAATLTGSSYNLVGSYSFLF